jgi:hypothetical protein
MPALSMRILLFGGLSAIGLSLVPSPTLGAEVPKEYRKTIETGFKWLVRQQQADGRFEGIRGTYPVTMTSMAGMAMLMEGSTLREGKFRHQIRKCADFVMGQAKPYGLIGNPVSVSGQDGRYMYEHGFGLLFLSCLVGEEDTLRRRKELVPILERAAKYSYEAQHKTGGWGYVTARDQPDFDEGSVTITQMQAIRAARNSGVVVPGDCIKNAVKYHNDSTSQRDGGVCYQLRMNYNGQGSGLPAITAAGVACGFSAGDYNSPSVKKWLTFCKSRVPEPDRRSAHDEYLHYYYAQCIYVLGEDRYAKLFPESRESERLTWSKYRKALFGRLMDAQSSDGSWSSGNWTASTVGPVYCTAAHLTIMQLDKGALPIYQR